jgi:hypothetical protein
MLTYIWLQFMDMPLFTLLLLYVHQHFISKFSIPLPCIDVPYDKDMRLKLMVIRKSNAKY